MVNKLKYETAIVILRIQEEIRSNARARQMKETANIKAGEIIPDWVRGYVAATEDAISSIAQVIKVFDELEATQ